MAHPSLPLLHMYCKAEAASNAARMSFTAHLRVPSLPLSSMTTVIMATTLMLLIELSRCFVLYDKLDKGRASFVSPAALEENIIVCRVHGYPDADDIQSQQASMQSALSTGTFMLPVGVAAAGMRPLLALTPSASSAFSSVTSCSHQVLLKCACRKAFHKVDSSTVCF